MNPKRTVNVHMHEFKSIGRIFVSKLTPHYFNNTHFEPFQARKFIISLHPIEIVLSEYLPGIDLDELK